jgi:hypothetical protein
VVGRRYSDYLGPDGDRVDLADLLANSVFEDPEARIWISPVDRDKPSAEWNASCQVSEDAAEFYGNREQVVTWARSQPATRRFMWAGRDFVDLDPDPGDAPAPPPTGPTIQIRSPDHDGRWVAVWFHRGEVKQSWGSREEVCAWAICQPAERRLISENGREWRPLQDR